MRRAGFRTAPVLPPPGALAHLRAPVAHRDPMRRSVQVPPHASPGTQQLLEAFQNTADWTQGGGPTTFALDSTPYGATNPPPLLPYPQTQGIKVVTASGVAMTATKTVNLDLSAGFRSIRLWTYSWDANSAGTPTINVRLATDSGVTNYFGATKNGGNVSGFSSTGGAWNMWTFIPADFIPTGTPSWSSPIIRLQMRISPGASNVATYTLALLTIEYQQPQPVVLFVFDDCHQSIYKLAYPYMRARGIRGTVFHVHTLADTLPYMSTSWLQELDAAGWDIGNHTEDHTNWFTSSLTTAQMQTEVTSCQTWLNSLGLTRASAHVAYPAGEAANNGAGANAFLAMSNAGMLSGRSTNNLNRQSLPVAAPYYWGNVYSLGNTITFAAAKTQLSTYMSFGGVLAILTHVLIDPASTSTQWTPSDFYKLVDYVVAQNIPCVTISEFWRLQQGQSVAVPRGAY
jgi:peptidoglycan/xylan/chitin deacetylase (PgdA/CDA1 family)